MRRYALVWSLTMAAISACSTTRDNPVQPAEAVAAALSKLTKRVDQLEADVALIQATPRDSLGACPPNDPHCCDEQTTDCD